MSSAGWEFMTDVDERDTMARLSLESSMNIARVIASLAILLASACPGGTNNEPEPAAGVVELVDTLAVSGILVMVDMPEANSSTLAVNLLDPRTNTRSSMQYPVRQPVGVSLPIDVSRDGKRMAHITPAGAVLVTRFVDLGGSPDLELVRAFENIGEVVDLRFNAYGDRVATDLHWLNVETGEVYPCDPGGATGRVEILPDGYHYRCGPAVYRDGVLVAENINPQWWGRIDAPYATGPSTTDGQLLSPSIRLEPFVYDFTQPFGELDGLAFPDWDATTWRSDSVRHGSYIAPQPGNDGSGFGTTVCVEINSDDKARESSRVDPVRTFQDGALAIEEGIWPLEGPLESFYLREQSQTVFPIGVHPGTQEVVYVVTTAVKGSGPQCPNPAVESFLVAISPTGESRSYDMIAQFEIPGAPLESSRRLWDQTGPLRDYGMLNLGGGDFLLPTKNRIDLFTSGRTEMAFLGYVAGEPARLPGVSVSSEGSALFNDEFIDDVYKICARSLSGDLRTRCMPGNGLGRPLFVAAEGLMASETHTTPLVRALSHTARPEGSVLTIWGTNFGNAGSIELADVTISSTDAIAWTDDRIDIVVTDTWPERAILRVESGGKRSGEGGLERWFRRTPRIETPLDGIPEPLELRQGLNRVDLGIDGGLQALEPDADGLYTLFSEGADETVGSYRSIGTDGLMRIVRTLTFDELVDATTWQPISVAAAESPIVPHEGLAWVGGELLDLASNVRPRGVDSGRVVMDPVLTTAPDVQNPAGIPQHFRESDRGAFSADVLFRNAPTLISGWESIPLTAVTERPQVQGLVNDFGVAGAFVVALSPTPDGTSTQYQVSRDAGVSFDPATPTGTVLGNLGGVVVGGVPSVLAFDLGVAPAAPKLIAQDGAMTDATINVDDAARLALSGPGHVYTSGPVVIYWKPGLETSQAAILDMSATNPALQPMSFTAPLYSLFHDREARSLIAVLADGTVLEATFDQSAPAFSEVELNITLTDGVTLQPRDVMKLPDGRWLVRGLTENSPRWMSSSGPAGAWVVSPR